MTAPRRLPVVRPDASTAAVTLTVAADPTAPVLVLVPAMGVRAAYYAPFAAALCDAGFHAAVTEPRGHEEPDGRRPGRRYDFGYAELVADLEAALAVVRDEVPAAPLVLAGHSMGGQLASVFLADHPDAAVGLVLLASGTPHWRVWGPWQLVRTQAALGLALVVGHFPGRRVGFAGREARGVMRDWARIARDGRFATGRPPRPHLDRLRTLTLPVLAVTVEADPFGPPRAARALLRLLPRANAETVRVRPGPGEPPLVPLPLGPPPGARRPRRALVARPLRRQRAGHLRPPLSPPLAVEPRRHH